MSIALQRYLNPLLPYLANEKVSELCINKPQELWVEEQGRFVCHKVKQLTQQHLDILAELIAENNSKNRFKMKPLLSANLPSGERCQLIWPPACDQGQFICSIRKPHRMNLTLSQWEQEGAFSLVKRKQEQIAYVEKTMRQCIKTEQWSELLFFAVRLKLNILISGGTSSAKTTLLNSCLKEINPFERLITIEDVREVNTDLANCVHLLAQEDEKNPYSATMLDLLKASFRLRPDRIFYLNFAPKEAYPFLRACISGHPGSLTTLHADSIHHAKEQLCLMLSEAPELQTANEVRLKTLIASAIQVMVQMRRLPDGRRIIEDIEVEGI